MRIIRPTFQIIRESSPTKLIERVARVCYKSEDKICKGSDTAMIKNLLSKRHLAMLEHASLCFKVNSDTYCGLYNAVKAIGTIPRSQKEPAKNYLWFTDQILLDERPISYHHQENEKERFLISGNVRAWYETLERLAKNNIAIPSKLLQCLLQSTGGDDGIFNKWVNDDCKIEKYDDEYCKDVTDMMIFFTNEEQMVHERVSVLFTVDRGVTHELVRMRECSFAQESTRYCNYYKDKYGNEITFIQPWIFNDRPDMYKEYDVWTQACEESEKAYLKLIQNGVQPQWARSVLNNSVKADIVVTANLQEWKHIFALRACDETGPAHPQMKEVMVPLLHEMRCAYPFAFNSLIIPEKR